MEASEYRRVRCPVCRSLLFEASVILCGEIRIKCQVCTRRFHQPVIVTLEFHAVLAIPPAGAVDSAPSENFMASTGSP